MASLFKPRTDADPTNLTDYADDLNDGKNTRRRPSGSGSIDPANALLEQQKRALDQIRPACVRLTDAIRDFTAETAKVKAEVKKQTEIREEIDSVDGQQLDVIEIEEVNDVVDDDIDPEAQADPVMAAAAQQTEAVVQPDASALVPRLQDVRDRLKFLAADSTFIIDSNLGDYIFFPIDVLFIGRPILPIRALELVAEIIQILLDTAWRLTLDGPLGLRLLGKLALLVDERRGNDVGEEIHLAVLKSFDRVFVGFRAMRRTDKFDLFQADNLPVLAEAIYVTLSAIEPTGKTRSSSLPVQMAAIAVLSVFCKLVRTAEMMATQFLPGIVSTLTKVMSTKSAGRRHFSVVEASLHLLTDQLVYTLDDGSGSHFWRSDEERETAFWKSHSWLEPVVPHVRKALHNIALVRHHDRPEVRIALGRLCVQLLENCRLVLKEAVPELVETFITSLSQFATSQQVELEAIEPMRQLLIVDSRLQDHFRAVLADWVRSVPTVMQHPDPAVRARSFDHIRFAIGLVAGSYCDLSLIAASLREQVVDSVNLEIRIVDRLQRGSPSRPVLVAPSGEMGGLIRATVETVPVFEPLYLRDRADKDVLVQLSAFLSDPAVVALLLDKTGPLVAGLANLSEYSQTASLYLLLLILRSSFESTADLGEFAFLADTSGSLTLLDEVYSFALDLLVDHDSDRQSTNWRLRALALETVALQANQYKAEFRLELVDALYPILSCAGAAEEPLREHALVCLGQVASSCGYSNTAEMLVGNADYLVNAIGLKLGLFERHSCAPAVLAVLVRLCGPAIVPYMADLVDSMFAALEANHYAPDVVESLFTVLDVVAREAARTAGLDVGIELVVKKLLPVVADISDHDCRDGIARVVASIDVRDGDDAAMVPLPDSTIEEISTPNEEADNQVSKFETEETSKPDGRFSRNRPYGMLLRIATLTQHYLPYSSPSFRRSLLGLLTKSFPTLSLHDNSFLPLIHSVWPAVMGRMRNESDGFVVAAAIDLITVMAGLSGDFLKSRVDECWSLLWRVAVQVGPTRLSSLITSSASGSDDQSKMVMGEDEMVRMLIKIGNQPNDQSEYSSSISGRLENQISKNKLENDSITIVSPPSISNHIIDKPETNQGKYIPMTQRVQQQAVTRALLALVAFVGLDLKRSRMVVEWLYPVLDRDSLINTILDRRNGDLVWWVKMKRERVSV